MLLGVESKSIYLPGPVWFLCSKLIVAMKQTSFGDEFWILGPLFRPCSGLCALGDEVINICGVCIFKALCVGWTNDVIQFCGVCSFSAVRSVYYRLSADLQNDTKALTMDRDLESSSTAHWGFL